METEHCDVLIIGCGPSGSTAAKKVAENGHDVIGVDNFSRYGKKDIERDYKFLQSDLTDREAVNKVCNECAFLTLFEFSCENLFCVCWKIIVFLLLILREFYFCCQCHIFFLFL